MTSFDSFHAITGLLYRYAECVDLADFDGIGELFAHGKMTNEGFPGEIVGAAAVRATYAGFNKVHPDGTMRTRHVTTNAIVDADEAAGTATCRSYFTVVQCTPDLPLQVIVSGRYHDRFERVDGVWRFAHRHIHLEAMGNVTEHLLIDPNGLRA